MSKKFRVKCSCGEVTDAIPGAICHKCKQPIPFAPDGMISLYRKGSPLGVAAGFGVYVNGEPYGYIGNRELIQIPVRYGQYNLHVAAGMNRRCNDFVLNITPENREAFVKVWMKPGFWTNSFVLEYATKDEMPF